MRHGETEWARDGKHTGLTDIPLTEKGESQAAGLGRRIESIPFKHIFSSPLKRALDTCSICGFDPQIDKDLVEWDYGAYEGLTSPEIHETNPKWNVFTHGAPNGESVDSVAKRADRFLKKIEKLEGKIAVFTSGHFSRAFVTRWLDLPIETGRRFSLATASLSILGYEHTKRALKLWNDTSHHPKK
ncbi:MAG: histidine phosphatase family protein [Chlamydiia bacterium]|nr:histidine phosphatase family protein [Chlamydiia bacterium]